MESAALRGGARQTQNWQPKMQFQFHFVNVIAAKAN